MSAIPGPHDRPDVPEFWHLSEIVLQMDGRCETPEGFRQTIEDVIPTEVLTYMSTQRALRLLVDADDPLAALKAQMVPHETLATIAAMYVDGFIAGAMYQQRYAKT